MTDDEYRAHCDRIAAWCFRPATRVRSLHAFYKHISDLRPPSPADACRPPLVFTNELTAKIASAQRRQLRRTQRCQLRGPRFQSALFNWLQDDSELLQPWADGPQLVRETVTRLDSRVRATRELGERGRRLIVALVLRPWCQIHLSNAGRPRGVR